MSRIILMKYVGWVLLLTGIQPSLMGQEVIQAVTIADSKYHSQHYAEAGMFYVRVFEQEKYENPLFYIKAAQCYALDQNLDSAFYCLHKGGKAGFRDLDYLHQNEDFEALKEHRKWKKVLKLVEDNRTAYHDPEKAKVITSDIQRFWKCFDKIDERNSRDIFEKEYLNPGSLGLKEFFRTRVLSLQGFLFKVKSRKTYFSDIREATKSIKKIDPEIKRSFQRLHKLYPEAVFPDIYLVIGSMTARSTPTSVGLLVGVELYSKTDSTSTEELNAREKAISRTVDKLPALIAHDLVHYQQSYEEAPTLLAACIREGVAEFISVLITGQNAHDELYQYGKAHEKEIWDTFYREMYGKSYQKWLFNESTVEDKPVNLGFWIGYKICESYYAKAPDKQKAIQEMLHIRDFQAFFDQSGYGHWAMNSQAE
ncbi:DUF2268 domain-containing putative Zn-dependent protease [Rapidithrix thailandica]|uniref:DUF2268 domain-containing putative Zn-dependent protease n=1 Tax=Rapidithrix thailandica TaxID=413964 RepID=A0AAW9S6J0_9BACT